VDGVILKCYTWYAALVEVVGLPTGASRDGSDRPLELEEGNRPLMPIFEPFIDTRQDESMS
jgi:hypothetical protein